MRGSAANLMILASVLAYAGTAISQSTSGFLKTPYEACPNLPQKPPLELGFAPGAVYHGVICGRVAACGPGIKGPGSQVYSEQKSTQPNSTPCPPIGLDTVLIMYNDLCIYEKPVLCQGHALAGSPQASPSTGKKGALIGQTGQAIGQVEQGTAQIISAAKGKSSSASGPSSAATSKAAASGGTTVTVNNSSNQTVNLNPPKTPTATPTPK